MSRVMFGLFFLHLSDDRIAHPFQSRMHLLPVGRVVPLDGPGEHQHQEEHIQDRHGQIHVEVEHVAVSGGQHERRQHRSGRERDTGACDLPPRLRPRRPQSRHGVERQDYQQQ